MSDDPGPRPSGDGAPQRDQRIQVFEAGVVGDDDAGFQTVRGVHLVHSSGIEATALSYGAGLVSLRLPIEPGTGAMVEVMRPRTDLATLQTTTGRFVGATVGRVANRIAGASFELLGTRYVLDANEPPNQLHGGVHGFHSQVWNVAPLDDVDDDEVGVRFTLTSSDGDGGYPGTVRAEAIYRLGDRRLEIEYRATTDTPTPINLANHAYWNLSGPDGDETIGDHRLRIAFDHVLLTDDTGLPVPGPPAAVAGTRFAADDHLDLRSMLAAGELDHCYVGPVDVDRVAVVLEHRGTGRRLSISTDQPGVQVYAGQHFVPPHQAIAFEPQMWPDSPNRPDFPSTLIHPGETYRNRSVYRFDW